MSETSRSERYILQTGEPAAARLRLLQRIVGAATESWLRRAGLERGMHVADIGCGVGVVTAHLAREVGPDGSVLGLDASEAQVAMARRALEAQGLWNATFLVASAYDTNLPRSAFDLVYCGRLLCHLQRPLDALREMCALLKPGGTLVCEDIERDAMFTEPQQEVYLREVARIRETAAARGVIVGIGRRLPSMLEQLGLA